MFFGTNCAKKNGTNQREKERKREREKERERECVCVCVLERERERVLGPARSSVLVARRLFISKSKRSYALFTFRQVHGAGGAPWQAQVWTGSPPAGAADGRARVRGQTYCLQECKNKFLKKKSELRSKKES